MIMQCITTVSYSIMVNGEPKVLFILLGGYGKVNLCLFFLFLFCAEGLNALLTQVAKTGDIRGYSLCRARPKITHLFFADDCLLFCRATLLNVKKSKVFLHGMRLLQGNSLILTKLRLSLVGIHLRLARANCKFC